MAWTTPKTNFGSETLTSAQVNAIGANLNYLFSPNSAYWFMNESTTYSTTSTSFVSVDATAGKGSLTIDTDGGNVLIMMSLSLTNTAQVIFDVEVDGVSISNGSNGLTIEASSGNCIHTFVGVYEGLSDGNHTFEIKWKVTSGTRQLYAGGAYQSFWGVARIG